jgi:4-diphosphocytidyl-2-C-methyl-D-erythritol kinase
MDEYLKLLTLERSDRRMRLRSPAKINLFLEPLRKRPDGYHEIVTVMQTIDLCDELELELGGTAIELDCDDPELPRGRENLAWQAAEAFVQAARLEHGVRIRLSKRIPVGGGLGGGSSNAGTTLLGLNELAGSPLRPCRLARLAASLGSDVSFFLHGGTALCRGRGERVKMLKRAPEFWVVLVTSPIRVSTRLVYEGLNLGLTKHPGIRRMLRSINDSDVGVLRESLYNGLTEAVFAQVPPLEQLHKEVTQQGLPYPQLSGSGSTLYGVCCSRAEAAALKDRLQRGLPGDVFVAVARNRLAPAKEIGNGNHRGEDQP